MIKLFLLLKWGRFQKKSLLYKRVWMMSFDVMMLFYVFVFLGYFIWAFAKEGTILETVSQFTLQLEEISLDYFWVIMTVIPIGLLFRTFTRPGITISSAEHTATVLPYTPWQIWWMAACARWCKLAIILFFIGTVLFLFSPTSGSVILLYIGLLLFINMMMTFVEWRVFQLHFLWKLFILFVGITVNILSILTYPPVVAIGTMIVLMMVSACLLPRVVVHVDWKKVTAACDYYIWNMFLISYITKQKMKKERSYTIWQRMPFWKKALPYKKTTVYQRLWHVYWQRQFGMVSQFIGILLVLVGFIPVTNHWLVKIVPYFGFSLTPLKDWYFLVALALAIHMYVSVAAVIWKDRLTVDIVHVLPWDLLLFQRTFIGWTGFGSMIFILPIWIYALEYWSVLFLVQMIIAYGAFLFLLYWKVIAASQSVSEHEVTVMPQYVMMLGYGLLVMMIVSTWIPYMIIGAIILLVVVAFIHYQYSARIRL